MRIPALLFLTLFGLMVVSAQKNAANIDAVAHKFTDAAGDGDVRLVRSMLDEGIGVNIQPSHHKGWTALMAAATSGKADVVRLLLSRGANPNVTLDDGETPLYQAAQSFFGENRPRVREIVEELIKVGAMIDTRTKEGTTPLMRYAWVKMPEIVSLLLAAKANPFLVDKEGRSSFQYAVANNDSRSTELLLPFFKELNKPDRNGETCLMWTNWGERTEALKILLAAKADPNVRNPKDGTSPLMISAQRLFRDEVRLLLNSDADVNAKDKKGRTALMYLSSSRFRMNEIGAHGDGFVVWLGATFIIDDMVKAGAKIDERDSNGQTALMLAVKAGNAHFADSLLRNGADPNIKDNQGKTAKAYETEDYVNKRESLLNLEKKVKTKN